MKRPWPLILVLASLAAQDACRRAEEEPWQAEEPDPPALAEGLTISPPSGGAIDLRRTFTAGDERTWSARMDYRVGMRGRPMAPMILAVSDSLDLRERVASTGPDGSLLEVRVENPVVSMDPRVDEVEDDRQRALEDVSLELSEGPDGRIVRVASRSEAPGESLYSGNVEPHVRAIEEALRRLMPLLPARAVVPGETWPFATVLERPLPGDRPARLSLAGRYRFQGLAEYEGRDVAVLDLEYTVAAAREGGDGTPSGRILDGTGSGRAVFLVDPSDGTTVRSQVVESTHVVVELGAGRRVQTAEQIASLNLDLALEEGGE